MPTVLPSTTTAKRPPFAFLGATTRSWMPFAVKETQAPLVAKVRTVPAHAEAADADFQVPV